MGLISGVLLLLPLAPVRGVEWVADRLLEAAEREQCDPATIRARLGELNRAYEAGELTEEEFEEQEERLLDQLEQRVPRGSPAAVTRTRTRTRTDRDQGTSHD
ncbi:gas vesicle protein GvpG [Streptomyces oryzae]|uniref:Gas vesicle protein GvpG n=1 Tax=Streptomyces oryzae TaxID=1434886 RepID=A0ABS3XG94_9ACTN|nr:gas vesicle protein GvpG [Streptomyces oryzae]MBO8194047.1 gas vesicle protein GvpG [Streptomyces oryzae]